MTRGNKLEQQANTGARKNRITSYILIFVFIAPMIAAWVIFKYFPDVVKSMGTTNQGTFVYPVRPLEVKDLASTGGKPLAESYFKDKWTIVYIDKGPCDQECQLNIIKAHQVMLAQGPEMGRVQQMVILAGQDDLSSLGKVLNPEKDLTIVHQDPATRSGWFRVFTLPDGKNPVQARRIYLVDPLGQLMMYYSFDHKDKTMKRENGMRRDLKKLLKDSKMG